MTPSNSDSKIQKTQEKFPILVARDALIFPRFAMDLVVGRKESLEAIKASQEKFDNKLILLQQKDPEATEIDTENMYRIGVLCKVSIKKVWGDGNITVTFKALSRINVTEVGYYKTKQYFYAREYNDMSFSATPDQKELGKELIDRLNNLANVKDGLPESVISKLSKSLDDPEEIINTLAQYLVVSDLNIKRQILEEPDPTKQLNIILAAIVKRTQSNIIEEDISKRIKSNIDQQQREFYLREKLRTIKEELGEMDGSGDDLSKYLEKLDKEPYPEHMKTRVQEEISRYEAMPPVSSEANILKTYIDWMMALPWYEKSAEIKDLDFAQKALDKDHFGLEKVKERIIEHLAVNLMKENNKGQIICLVGPPGVGKTSLAKSISKATGRNFVKVALGGVKDEAEIRGHRRTYLGSMPGRIIQGMKKAKTINPLFLIDEIDKMASDYRGDPASALLEVLDPEQNFEFSDHYIEENYDLSNVMFIATANYFDNIPEALIDRMEIISLSSYTEIEKAEIAKRHLVGKVLKNNGLTSKQIKFTDEAIMEIIKYYTREAGVRQLEQLLTQISRKFIVKFLKKKLTTDEITPKRVNYYLGKRKFFYQKKVENSEVGVATGLAYTQYGGDTLPIEVNYFPGKGNLVLTGKLGEVMKESASIAFDYIKANAKTFDVEQKLFENNDLHIHVPEGAVPKDGPSAGITITTAIISALSKRPVSKNLGMTGEITLRGDVLPIGGLKEKSISAHRIGLEQILIPNDNVKDLDEIPKEVKKDLKITPVKHYSDVYAAVFNTKGKKQTSANA